ncbi:hypothetical protein QWY28_05685 [Nocardioides sp. SOB77]|uniref:CARDB domain-containing protein n=1 Tax=Nocardioides oceani TaxID=3058369 RepID=A0ABT8FDE0_9ACTN|nr:hypothetical protein [Nocardioides oceani]MDN4172425.1 hypothetical protein [Nocardioides oceani]
MTRVLARALSLVVGLGLLAGLPTGTTAPAVAASGDMWSFETRPDGAEPPAEPAHRIEDAYLVVNPGLVSGTVTLGAAPEEATDSEIQVSLGNEREDGTCLVRRLVGTPTFEPVRPNSREGASVRVELPLTGGAGRQAWTCVQLAVVAADGVVLDRREGTNDGYVIADPVGAVEIRAVRGKELRPGRWTSVEVTIRNAGSDAYGILVTGSGRGVRTEPAVYGARVYRDESVKVYLRVKLLRARGASLTIEAAPLGGFVEVHPDQRKVWLRPR